MSVFEFKEILWLLMLIPLGLVLGMGVIFVVSAARWVREQKSSRQFLETEFSQSAFAPRINCRRFLFEQPSRWLAIKTNNPNAVQAALELHDPTPCSWEEGLVEAREEDGKLFVSPSVSGWVLVVGSVLPDPSDDVDDCFHFLRELSRKLGHVQYFFVNRPLNYHGWAILDRGDVFRAYAWAGDTLWNQGVITAAERELDLQCLDYGERLLFSNKDAIAANTEKVYRLAGRWSLDPAALSENLWESDLGVVGNFYQSKSH